MKRKLKDFSGYVSENNEYDSIDGVNTMKSVNNDDGVYFGTKMLMELADKLGVEMTDNKIVYGDTEIDFYSETEKIHIGKKSFRTVDEAYDFIMKSEPQLQEKRNLKRFR
jgi:hypothetical protein